MPRRATTAHEPSRVPPSTVIAAMNTGRDTCSSMSRPPLHDNMYIAMVKPPSAPITTNASIHIHNPNVAATTPEAKQTSKVTVSPYCQCNSRFVIMVKAKRAPPMKQHVARTVRKRRIPKKRRSRPINIASTPYMMTGTCGLTKMELILDKLYITYGEWATDFGGAKKKTLDGEFKGLPFDYCALTLAPFTVPVCAPDGVVFDLSHIVPYLERHGTHPTTGVSLGCSDLTRLHYSKNAAGETHCPVTLKAFTDYSHIVANRRTGRVYSAEGLKQLDGRDYFTDEKFSKSDVIVLQDPRLLEGRNMAAFTHVRQARLDQLNAVETDGPESTTTATGLGSTATATATAIASGPGSTTTGIVTSSGSTTTGTATFVTSATSTAATLMSRPQTVDKETEMFQAITKPGKAVIRTNLGDLHLELYCPRVPRTCYNFLTLSRRGYYDDCRFHRLIPGFVIQGGDPSGTGGGGKSCWNKPFANEIVSTLSHSSRGILSMANKGPHSNGSQFFITFDAATHLDRLHPVFGKVVGGWDVLDKMEATATDSAARPTKAITIQSVVILYDPFEEYQQPKPGKPKVDPTIMVKRAKTSANTPLTIGKYIKKT
ncbi:hypothetical protein PSACC_01396 [Paramicrosporidium saccamoebae]|uniref:Peptidylprolyl isomerase n=1 Tax=Paramicrosporidium saccamoebae TaxID=1246581 RepID=A0A2H9TM30_9FUNG|nr:hypothetical protein PSACC_01396 [Paramicrosporidium saccamoebae]